MKFFPGTMEMKSLFVALIGLTLVACGEHGDDHGHDDHDHAKKETHGAAPATDMDEASAQTTITPAMAEASGVVVEVAGPALLYKSIDLLGRIEFAPSAKAEVRAKYVGEVRKLTKTVGDKVRAGEVLAVVESSQSLQTYTISAPISGVVLERRTNIGDVAGDGALYVIGDLARVQAELHVFPGDVGRIRDGQPVSVRSLDGQMTSDTRIAHFLPTAEAATQTLLVRAPLPNADSRWLPGMAVEAGVVVSETEVPLAVKRSGVQRFRDQDVVFVRTGTVYEAHPLKLGRTSKDWVEVLDGLTAGQQYVVKESFLIKADIEKSGAGHDH